MKKRIFVVFALLLFLFLIPDVKKEDNPKAASECYQVSERMQFLADGCILFMYEYYCYPCPVAGWKYHLVCPPTGYVVWTEGCLLD